MNDFAAIFIKGFILGFSIAAPVGPIGLLCINRTITQGWLAGISGGLGTAVADAAYAAVAAFGLTIVANFLAALDLPLRIVGAIGLGWLGWNTLKRAPAMEGAVVKDGAPATVFLQTLILTLTNPATILSFAAMFAGLGLGASATPTRAAALVAGTFAGSMAWWILLSSAIMSVRHRLTPQALAWINRAAGGLLLAFAAWLAFGEVQAILRV